MPFEEDFEQDHVRHKEDDLVYCDNKNCSTFGEYTFCYFDIHSNCEKYHRYMEKLVRGELRDH